MRRPKRILSLVGMAAAALSLTRVAVLVLESLAVVNDERQQDQELIALCRQGAARGSAKMREACSSRVGSGVAAGLRRRDLGAGALCSLSLLTRRWPSSRQVQRSV